MLYSEKGGFTDGINRKIIEIRKSEEWKEINEDDTDAIRRVFDSDFPKNEVKEILPTHIALDKIIVLIPINHKD